jgi:hypothetical protein
LNSTSQYHQKKKNPNKQNPTGTKPTKPTTIKTTNQNFSYFAFPKLGLPHVNSSVAIGPRDSSLIPTQNLKMLTDNICLPLHLYPCLIMPQSCKKKKKKKDKGI